MWPFSLFKKQNPTTRLTYLKPGPDDEPITEREVYVAGLNQPAKYANANRQKIIRRCRDGEPIYLVREPDNPYDPNAIILCRGDGTDIGYIPTQQAAEIAPRLDRGSPVTAVFGYCDELTTDEGQRLIAPRIILTPHKLRR